MTARAEPNNKSRYKHSPLNDQSQRTPDAKLHKVMSTKTNVRGSSLASEGIDNYIETQSIGVGLCQVPDGASTKRDDNQDEELIYSRMSMIN